MQAVIESKTSEYYQCVLENGDLISIHEDDFEDNVTIGDIVEINIKKKSSK